MLATLCHRSPKLILTIECCMLYSALSSQIKEFLVFKERLTAHCAYKPQFFLIHSSTDDLLSCCHILTVVNIGVQRSCQTNSSNSFACNTSGILGSYNHFSCCYLRYLHIIFHESVLIPIPTNSVQFFPFILNFISIFPSSLA